MFKSPLNARYITLIELTFLAALWGASFIFIRIAAPEFGPIPLIAVRVGVASLVLIPCLFFNNNFKLLIQHHKKLLLIGVLSAAIPFLLFAFSAKTVSAGVLSVLNATTPLWSAVVAWGMYKQTLPTLRVIGLIIGFLGVVILVYDQLNTPNQQLIYYVLPILATLCYGISGNLTQHHLANIPALVISFGSLMGSAVLLTPVAIITWPNTPISTQAWTSALVLAVVSTSFAYWVFFRLIQRIGPSQTMSVLYLSPAFAIVWGYLFLHETISLLMMLGIAVVFMGVSLALGLIQKKPSLPKT